MTTELQYRHCLSLTLSLLATFFLLITLSVFASAAAESTSPFNVSSSGSLMSYSGTDTDVIVPASVDGITITEISSSAFEDNAAITSVTLPDTITAIGNRAFENCTSLVSLNIPSGVTAIGDYAFRNCSSLTDISLPEKLTSLGNYAFTACASITEISIPAGVKSVPYSAFRDCSSLTRVSLPEGLTKIGYYAFYGCIALTEIELPSTLASIEDFAFRTCIYLEKIAIPEGVTVIRESAFEGCFSLVDISLPSSLKTIEEYAFYYCINLGDLIIPEGVSSIGEYAFNNCESVNRITLPDSITELGQASLPSNALIVFGTNDVIHAYAVRYGHGYICDAGSLEIPEFADAYEKVAWVVATYASDCKTDYDKALILYEWLCANVSYDYVYLNTGIPTSPLGAGGKAAMLDGTAVCHGYAQAYMWLLKEAGIEAVYVTGFGNDDAHAWNIAKIDGEWYHFDATWDEMGDGETHNYFALSDQAIRADHEQYTHLHLVCDSWDANYFYRSGQLDKALTSLRAAIESNISAGKYSGTINATSSTAYPLHSDAMAQTVALIVSNDTNWSVNGCAQVKAGIYREFEFTFLPDSDPVTSISVAGADPDDTTEAYSMLIGAELQLNATTVPANSKITFSSSNKEVLTVSDTGLVTAVNKGYADLTLSSGNASVSFRIYVRENHSFQIFGPAGVENQFTTQVEAEVGQTFESFVSEYYPPFLQFDSLSWSSSREDVATVDDKGKVTIVGGGNTTITAVSNSGMSSSYRITVRVPIVESVVFGQETYQGYVGQEIILDAHPEGCDPDDYKKNYGRLDYSVSDTSVANCSSYYSPVWDEEGQYWVYRPIVVGLKAGEVIITATATDGSGASASCKVVFLEPQHPDVLTFDSPLFTGNMGDRISLSLHISPEVDEFYKETYGRFDYSSSNADVAAFANSTSMSWQSNIGYWIYRPYVNCLAPGATVFTATTVDGSGTSGSTVIIVHYESKFELPANLTAIDSQAFSGLNVEEIIIPEGAKTIGAEAFGNCKELRLVLLPASLEFIDPTAFDGCSNEMTLVVHEGTYAENFAEINGFNAVVIPG